MAGKEREEAASLAYREIAELSRELVARLQGVTELDLSHNHFSDLRSLYGLRQLQTLILDCNKITSHTIFPELPKLKVLWVNKNEIANLSVFIETVFAHCPELTHLSMMNNKAAPSYFNGGSKQEFADYRHYVISRLPSLCYLDDSRVTSEEREAAVKVYGRRKQPQQSISIFSKRDSTSAAKPAAGKRDKESEL